MTPPTLLAVPNVSEGRDERTIDAIAQAFGAGGPLPASAPHEHAGVGHEGVRLLDVHFDPDHHRSVFTLAGRPVELADALLAGTRAAVARIDVVGRIEDERSRPGQHPHIGTVDVVPVVYLEQRDRGAACAAALLIADRIGEDLGVPVFLYGELTEGEPGSAETRAQLRRGGPIGLAGRMAGSVGQERLVPDFGPDHLHPSAGATLVAARAPLVAFNVQLKAPASVGDARRIAALIREGGAEGLPGVRAIGVSLTGGLAQVSMNVERPLELPLAAVIEAVARHGDIASAELVGLAPRAAFEGFPSSIPLPGFDPASHLIENALGC